MTRKTNVRRSRRALVVPLVAILIVIVAGLYAGSAISASKDALYVAVVGPMSGPDQADGQDMVRGVNLYLDQANANHGVNGRPVRLLVFDDQSSADVARQKALEIVEQGQALAVIGHLFSSTSASAGEVYRQYGIPAITGSATTESVTANNDWYFRTIFSNRAQASYLANYLKQVLDRGTATIVCDQDEYGSSLAQTFETKFEELGGAVKQRWSFDSTSANVGETLDEIEKNLIRAKTDDPGTIFIAAHANESEKIVAAIRRNGLPYPILGADSMGDEIFATQFSDYPEEQKHPGFFTDGIFATAPVIFDVAGEKAQQVRSDYQARYGTDPGWTVTAYYDAALVAVQAIKLAGVSGDPTRLAEERKAIRDRLAAINGARNAIKGANGNIYFDDQRSLANSVQMGTFAGGQFIPAMVQLKPINDLRGVSDLQSELQAGRIFLVDGHYMYRTRVVYTGIQLNQITDLDTKAATYNMDFYLWFRYQGKFEDANIDFVNADKELTVGSPIEEITTDDVSYRLYRIKADFRGNFSFRDYPFDRQELAVRFRHANQTRDRLIYVVDKAGMRNTSSDSLLAEWGSAETFNALGYWRPTWAGLFQDVAEAGSGMGNPQLLASDAIADMDASRFNLVIWIKRDALNFTIKNLFPVFIVVGVSYLVFFIPPKELGTRIGLGTSTLLTTAFFDLSLSNHLPDIGYIVAAEYFFYVVYLLAVFGIVVTITGFVEAKVEKRDEREALIRRLNLAGKIIYPTAIVITFILYAYRYGFLGALTHG